MGRNGVLVLAAVVLLAVGILAGRLSATATPAPPAVPRVAVPAAEAVSPLALSVTGPHSPGSPVGKRFPCGHLMKQYMASANGSEWGSCQDGHYWSWFRGAWTDDWGALVGSMH